MLGNVYTFSMTRMGWEQTTLLFDVFRCLSKNIIGTLIHNLSLVVSCAPFCVIYSQQTTSWLPSPCLYSKWILLFFLYKTNMKDGSLRKWRSITTRLHLNTFYNLETNMSHLPHSFQILWAFFRSAHPQPRIGVDRSQPGDGIWCTEDSKERKNNQSTDIIILIRMCSWFPNRADYSQDQWFLLWQLEWQTYPVISTTYRGKFSLSQGVPLWNKWH